MKSYYFTEEHEMFRDSLKSFLKKEVEPHIDQWEEAEKIPKEIWKKMGDMGFLGLGFPKEYGGMELDFFYDVIFCEEVSKMFSGGFMITQLVVQYMSGPYIMRYGSEELKQKYLPGLISGELISCIGISEPGAGSDVQNIQTQAIRQGDHYVVNGSKTFITNGVYGDCIVTVVKTDPEAGPAGVSLLVIDRHTEGVTATKLKKLGWHASDTAELAFDNVKVPVENLIGSEGQGFYYLMGGLQLERLSAGVSAYAGCEAALEYSLQYMAQRSAFGRKINKFQVLRHRIAQLASEIEACKQFVLYCCRLHNDGEYAVKECSMAKLLATELSDKVMYQCLQFFGGYGFMEEYKIARMFRDSRVGTIGGGSSEIMREIIAKMVIDQVAYESAGEVVGGGVGGEGRRVETSGGESRRVEHPPTPPSKGELGASEPSGGELESSTGEKKAAPTLVGLFDKLNEKTAMAEPLESILKFDFGEEKLVVDGTGYINTLSMEDREADCTVTLSFETFYGLIKGKINPMAAIMSQQVAIKGDMAIAMRLQSLFT